MCLWEPVTNLGGWWQVLVFSSQSLPAVPEPLFLNRNGVNDPWVMWNVETSDLTQSYPQNKCKRNQPAGCLLEKIMILLEPQTLPAKGSEDADKACKKFNPELREMLAQGSWPICEGSEPRSFGTFQIISRRGDDHLAGASARPHERFHSHRRQVF